MRVAEQEQSVEEDAEATQGLVSPLSHEERQNKEPHEGHREDESHADRNSELFLLVAAVCGDSHGDCERLDGSHQHDPLLLVAFDNGDLCGEVAHAEREHEQNNVVVGDATAHILTAVDGDLAGDHDQAAGDAQVPAITEHDPVLQRGRIHEGDNHGGGDGHLRHDDQIHLADEAHAVPSPSEWILCVEFHFA